MINFRAIFAIIAYRLREFFSEYQYSLLAPITVNILFVLVFLTLENYYSILIDSKSFVYFIAPGLIIMIVAQESYDIPSVALINMKQIGSFDDWLLAPISRIEILFSSHNIIFPINITLTSSEHNTYSFIKITFINRLF